MNCDSRIVSVTQCGQLWQLYDLWTSESWSPQVISCRSCPHLLFPMQVGTLPLWAFDQSYSLWPFLFLKELLRIYCNFQANLSPDLQEHEDFSVTLIYFVILFVSLIFNSSELAVFSAVHTDKWDKNKCIYYYNIVLYISDSVNNSCIIRHAVMFFSSPLPCLVCSLALSLCSITVPLKSVINRCQGRKFNSNSVFQKYLFQ